MTINGNITADTFNGEKFETIENRLEFPMEIPEIVHTVHREIEDATALTESMFLSIDE